MPELMENPSQGKGLRSRSWLLSYRTSSTLIDGRPLDMLHDFYVPALSLAVRYDRVAGYFRSSSLAAASMGFSAFVGHQGKMRLIVGAYLDPEDVRAILAGDRERLAARLNGELEGEASWPEGVRNGVMLLAWMVAHGYLEVRVAFRVHKETGEPLALDAVDDGYVHEKWFVLYDEFGNRMYGTGTLNESKTALILNAENIDVHCDWWGDTDRRRVDEAVEAFENLWQGNVPHLPVLTLPEAVRRRLIRFAEGIDFPVEVDGTRAAAGTVPPPAAMERLRFAVLRDAPKMPGGRFVGMETAPVEPWPHQAIVVRRLVETWPYSYILGDEVGLGKTIEAGLAFRSLYLAGLVKRILIAAPASLTRQWHRQMAAKMLLSFGLARTTPETAHEYIFPVEETRPARSLYEPDLVIISTGLFYRRERAEALALAAPFDIALVDEAHALRRHNPAAGCGVHPDYGNLYKAARDYLRPRARALWLATATPMQIHPVEVCDLLALTNRVGAFQYDPSLTLQYYDIMGRLLDGREPGELEWDFLRRAVKAVRWQDPMLWRFIEESVIDGRIQIALHRWLEYGRVPRGRDRLLMLRLLFSVSPLSRVMLRHTRPLLEIYRDRGRLQQNLPRRHILSLPRIEFTPLEQRIYDELEKYCNGLNEQIKAHGDRQAQQMLSFLLSFLRLRFASSLYALRQTLQRRLARVEATLRHQSEMEAGKAESVASEETVYESEEEDDLEVPEVLLKGRKRADLEWERERLQVMLNLLADLTELPSKMQELMKRLEQRRDRRTGRIRQTVIFTRFYDTLVDIVTRLRQADPGMRVGTYSGRGGEYYDPNTGSMVAVDREKVKELFLQGEIDVLVCTDAAAEGLNLQTADFLVNFDLGWNPMKIEQRIGRIDRIGQKHLEVYVLNLCYTGSAEEIVYGRLLSRLAEANLIVGTQQVSLLPVEPDDFRQLAEGTLTEKELEARVLEKLKEQRRRTESMEINPQELYEIYMRLERVADRRPVPVNLAAIWEALQGSSYLRRRGCTVESENGKPVLALTGIEGVPEGAVLTVSRELYEQGLAGDGRRLHFASYGDPVFERVLEHMNSFELPRCVRRLAVLVSGMDGVEVVGFAAACREAGGSRVVRLVLSWRDVENLQLAEGETLGTEEVEPLREKLTQMAREEFGHYLAAGRIEGENIRAARAQEMLALLVIRDLLEVKAGHDREDVLFSTALRDIESQCVKRERVTIVVPAEPLRSVAGDLLFDCRVPLVGDTASFLAPRILIRAAVDAASRLASGMKRELRVADMLSRLQREVEARRRKIR
ncbi:helicase-related protein [Moorella sulfitireducens]|uniref:helicase-related protein n=1 Tax=Neomoorella sulfitireducens TaxID=2972948 RepID=UPI0021AC086F|nr:helicase-related protein [Moorella sulfitireducens]